jgi:hypothetical protein
MGYKLKELPQNAYWQETKQFTIVDDEGNEIEIRVTESSKHYERFMWYEPGGWDEIDNDEINEYIDEQFGDDEWELENEVEKNMYLRMDAVYNKFVEENGEVNDFMKFNNLINEVNGETDYKKEYGKRFYDSYQYVFKKLRDKNDK